MESVCVRYLRTSWFSIGNQTSERSERVRFVIQTSRHLARQSHVPYSIGKLCTNKEFFFNENNKELGQK